MYNNDIIHTTKLFAMTHQQAFEQQKQKMDFYEKNNPDLIKPQQKRSETELFENIGIKLPADRPAGYLRLYPQDFIVEEKNQNNQIIRINEFSTKTDEQINCERQEGQNTLYSTLIKIGIPTLIALQKIEDFLKIPKTQIGYAGLKDADAVTAQQIAFPKCQIPLAKIQQTKIPNIFLTNFHWGKGSLNPGDLKQNIFTITIRTEKQIEKKQLAGQINKLTTKGFLNYYQSQRFGTPRFIAHKLGKLILQGNYEQAVKYFLFNTSDYDILLVRNLRHVAEKNFDNLRKVKELYQELPYTFFNELQVINYLLEDPKNYIGALIDLKNQTQLWVYAYASYLFNKTISQYQDQPPGMPKQLPLLLSADPTDQKFYQKYLQADKIFNIEKTLYPFKFLQLKKRLVPTKIIPQDVNYKIMGQKTIITFALEKGAYATTFLANLFELRTGLPIPDWVKTNEIDAKKILGLNDLQKIKQIFADDLYSKLDRVIDAE